jgi:uncharacterized membrane protein YedE/YeeE
MDPFKQTPSASLRDAAVLPRDDRAATSADRSSVSLGALLRVLAVGVYFGIVLAKSEVARWERVHKMFLFQEAHMYLIIGVGIAVAMVCMQLIKRANLRDVSGRPIRYKPKPYHLGVVLGGMLFGAGWAITGACPGPIYVQIGAGEWLAIATFLGALTGMYVYAVLKPRLPH